MTTDLIMLDTKMGAFALHRFRFALESQMRWSWAGFPGGEFHGGLGMMLARHAPEAYQALFAEGDRSRPRPYALGVSEAGSAAVFYLDLVLFGDAVTHFYACFDALAQLGEVGIGKDRARFGIAAVHAVKPLESMPVFSREDGHGVSWDAATTLADILALPVALPVSACEWSLSRRCA